MAASSSSTRSSSSSSSEIEDWSLNNVGSKPKITPMQGRIIRHLDRMNWAIRVCVVIGLVALVATIVLVCLTAAEYVHPFIALYTFSGFIGSFLVMGAINSCQRSIASKNSIDLDEYYAVKESNPKKKKEITDKSEKKKKEKTDKTNKADKKTKKK